MLLHTKKNLLNNFNRLSVEKKMALEEYAELLADENLFNRLKAEIEERRYEVKEGQVYSASEFWNKVHA